MAINEGTVVTSRIRLARNLSGYVFGSRLQKAKAREITAKAYYAAGKYGGFRLIEISKISKLEAERLKERYVISEALKNNVYSGAALVSSDDSFSIMINEEDHVREQRLEKGFALKKAYEALSPLDRWLDKNLKFCKDERWGYLTACPTNLGTGMRASVMMFLPGLAKRNMIGALLTKAQAAGLTVRGVFGEGSDGESCLYQVSNEVTLGVTPERIVSNVESFVEELAELERTNLEIFYEQNVIAVQDNCMRAAGILQNCKILPYGELASLVSELKTGAMLDIIKLKNVCALDDMLVNARPAGIKSELLSRQSGANAGANYPIEESAAACASSEFFKDENTGVNVFRAAFVRACLNELLVR